MTVKEQITEAARKLFNQNGIRNVTLRDVAKNISRSYGNITYHFRDKETLILNLYEQYLSELQQINLNIRQDTSLLNSLLKAPEYMFSLSMKYLFFFVDYVEIRRAYPALGLRIDKDNQQRMQQHLVMLTFLRDQAILRPDLADDDLWYLMELSGAVRTFFFLRLQPEEISDSPELKKQYVEAVNRLLRPYLAMR